MFWQHLVWKMSSCFSFVAQLEKKVREMHALLTKLEEEKYDWEVKNQTSRLRSKEKTYLLYFFIYVV